MRSAIVLAIAFETWQSCELIPTDLLVFENLAGLCFCLNLSPNLGYLFRGNTCNR